MTNEQHTLQNRQLTDLYRRLDDNRVPAWLDAETLVAYGRNELSPELTDKVRSAIDSCPALAALQDALQALAPATEATAAAVAQPPRLSHTHHRRAHTTARRHRPSRRAGSGRLRWVGIAAAIVLTTIGVFGLQQFEASRLTAQQAGQHAVDGGAPADRPDAIFDNGMDGRAMASHDAAQDTDHIFRSDFKAARS